MTERENRHGMRGETPPGADCAAVRDLLSLMARGHLSAGERRLVDEHVAACEGCRDEAAFLVLLDRARPEPPPGFVGEVLARHRAEPGLSKPAGGDRRGLAWSLSAAAGLVLALGVGVVWQTAQAPDPVWSLALDAPVEGWNGEDWMVAGAPLLDEVSEETLRTLLEEMDP